MSELWLPKSSSNPDIENVFDLMEVFQEGIENREAYEDKIMLARQAAISLARIIKRLEDEQRAVCLETQLAVVRSTEHEDHHIVVKDVGVIGDLTDANVIQLGEHVPMSLAMELDVTHFFNPADPDESDIILTSGNVPITHVNYIEHETR